mmetsp:Transcript_53123/g.165022  ORF Transcript_53123/g.165022 Transcript_53123/m.165022 type:complete len:249 (+) Transcript_53123:289-1035(+)
MFSGLACFLMSRSHVPSPALKPSTMAPSQPLLGDLYRHLVPAGRGLPRAGSGRTVFMLRSLRRSSSSLASRFAAPGSVTPVSRPPVARARCASCWSTDRQPADSTQQHHHQQARQLRRRSAALESSSSSSRRTSAAARSASGMPAPRAFRSAAASCPLAARRASALPSSADSHCATACCTSMSQRSFQASGAAPAPAPAPAAPPKSEATDPKRPVRPDREAMACVRPLSSGGGPAWPRLAAADSAASS